MRKTGMMMSAGLACLLAVWVIGVASAQDDPAGAAPVVTADQLLASAQDAAVREILAASRSGDAQKRANALEAMSPRPKRLLPMAQAALSDENPAVRYAALVLIGELKLRSLGPSAARLLGDPEPSVRAAAMYAADACGERVSMAELPRMLRSNTPSVRGNAAMLIGLMGDQSAVPMLKELARTPMPRVDPTEQSLVNLQIEEALLELGDESAIEPIRAKMWSSDYDVKVMSVLALGRLQDRRMIPAFRGMLSDQPVELEIAAAQSLAEMGLDDGLQTLLDASAMTAQTVADESQAFVRKNPGHSFVPLFRRLAADPAAQERVAGQARAQSAFGLALIDSPAAAAALARLVGDDDPNVRLAGAAGVLKAMGREAAPRRPI